MEENITNISANNIKPPKWLHWENNIGMILAGLGLGWIIGMSNTPIIRDIILAFVAVITTVIGLMNGFAGNTNNQGGFLKFFIGTHKISEDGEIKEPIKQNMVRILPIGLFLICLATGAGAGLFSKNNYLLVGNYRKMASELGIPDSIFLKKYNRQIFETRLDVVSDSLNAMDSLHIYQSFELMYGKVSNDNAKLIAALGKAKPIRLHGEQRNGIPGLMNDKIKINECNEANRLPSGMLKEWLLKRVNKADKLRIEAIDINDEAKLKAELKNLCKNLK